MIQFLKKLTKKLDRMIQEKKFLKNTKSQEKKKLIEILI